METPQVPPSQAMPFRARLRTRWSDEDNHSVLNNAVYMTLFEEARFAYFSAQEQLGDNRFPFVLGQCNVRYLRPGRGGAEVDVELATLRLGTSSFEQAYRVIDVDSGAVWSEARAVLVVVDPASGKSSPMDAGFRAALAHSLLQEAEPRG